MTIDGSALGKERTYAVASWLFLRLLGIAYLFAFWSLALQIDGLIGSEGILPARDYLGAIGRAMDADGIGASRLATWPTIFWLDSSDRFLQSVAIAGVVMAALLAAGCIPGVLLPLLWGAYLSLSVVCGDFLSYQWDALLLETGLVAMPLGPFVWWQRPQNATNPPSIARWLTWWLLFRLMFGSGVVKLASGDPTWRGLDALAVHYETQPLPTPIAWYLAQMPLWFHRGTTAVVLALELFAPWLIFGARRARLVACTAIVALQVAIALTGNYAYFNLLTVALSLMLLDDRTFVRFERASEPAAVRRDRSRIRLGIAWAIAVLTLPVSVVMLATQFGIMPPGYSIVSRQAALIDPFRSVNRYGLFAVMTTTRLEIVVEGSLDGLTWLPYEFRYKPGDPMRGPHWIAPFQPRLDWQMWFAALSRFEEEAWFQQFGRRLLARSPPVLRLLARDPFEGQSPRFLRAVLYRYRFSDAATRRRTGAWWTRQELGLFSPVLPAPASVELGIPSRFQFLMSNSRRAAAY